MPSTSEVGHAKNVAEFEQAKSFVSAYDPSKPYDPSNPLIILTALDTKFDDGVDAIGKVNTANAPFNIADEARRILFAPIPKLATKILSAVKASPVPQEYVANVQQIIRKLQGRRAKAVKAPTDPNATPPLTISVSQRSFDNQINFMDQLVKLLAVQPLYDPNEPELKVATLTTLLSDMVTANSLVVSNFTKVSNARIYRDTVLYHPETGMLKMVTLIKSYVKSLYGAKSVQYKQLTKLKFKKPGKLFI